MIDKVVKERIVRLRRALAEAEELVDFVHDVKRAIPGPLVSVLGDVADALSGSYSALGPWVSDNSLGAHEA